MSEDRNSDPSGSVPEPLDDGTQAEEDFIRDDEPDAGAPEDSADDGDRGSQREAPDTASEAEEERPAETGPTRHVRPTSGTSRWDNITRENRDLRQRLDALERQQQQPRGPTPEQLAEQQRREEQAMFEQVAMLAPHEAAARVSQFYSERTRREVQQAIQLTQVQVWDAADRQSYDRELADNPRLQRFADQVEQLHRQYPGVSRIDLLDKAVGEATRRNLKSARTRQTNQAAAVQAANGARPPGGRGNVAAPSRTAAARRGYEHLRGVLI